MHLIGLELKKAIKVKWVADFRDPWSKLDFSMNIKWVNVHKESICR